MLWRREWPGDAGERRQLQCGQRGEQCGRAVCAGATTVTWTVTDGSGNTATAMQVVTVRDTQPPQLSQGSIAACYTTSSSAEADAIAATTATDNCGGTITKTASTAGTCSAVVTVTATDVAGNSASVTYNTRIDGVAPVISATTATQNAVNVQNNNCATQPVLQGTVAFTVTASDSCSLVNGHPGIALVNGANLAAATFVNESPPGTFNYTWTVGPTTASGTWTATVSASDICQTTTDTFTLCVNAAQITGQVQLEGFVGTGTIPANTRTVTFVATTNIYVWHQRADDLDAGLEQRLGRHVRLHACERAGERQRPERQDCLEPALETAGDTRCLWPGERSEFHHCQLQTVARRRS